MRLVAFTCVRDEVDIVEAFVRHTLSYASHLVVFDRGSSDGTDAILTAMRSEGHPLTLLRDDALGNDQAARMTWLLRLCATRFDADWFLPLDADEFLQGANLTGYIEPDRPLALRWRGYVPNPNDNATEPNPVRRIRHRRDLPAWEDSKVLIPRSLAVRPGVRLRQGSHGVLVEDCEPPLIEQSDLSLAHFPVRSPEQYLTKMTIRALQYRLTPNRDPANGWTFDAALEAALRYPAKLAAQFAVAAGRYGLPEAFAEPISMVADPIDYRGGPLRFTSGQTTVNAFRTVLAFAAQLTASPQSSVSQPEMTDAAVRRERLLRDQSAAIRRLEHRVRELEAERSAPRRRSWWRQAA